MELQRDTSKSRSSAGSRTASESVAAEPAAAQTPGILRHTASPSRSASRRVSFSGDAAKPGTSIAAASAGAVAASTNTTTAGDEHRDAAPLPGTVVIDAPQTKTQSQTQQPPSGNSQSETRQAAGSEPVPAPESSSWSALHTSSSSDAEQHITAVPRDAWQDQRGTAETQPLLGSGGGGTLSNQSSSSSLLPRVPSGLAHSPFDAGPLPDIGSSQANGGSAKRNASLRWKRSSKVAPGGHALSPVASNTALPPLDAGAAGVVSASMAPMLVRDDGSVVPLNHPEFELRRIDAIVSSAELQVQLLQDTPRLHDDDDKPLLSEPLRRELSAAAQRLGELGDLCQEQEHGHGDDRSDFVISDVVGFGEKVDGLLLRVNHLIGPTQADKTTRASKRWTLADFWTPSFKVLYAAIIYVAVGLLYYSLSLKWPFVQSLYFVALVGSSAGSCHHPLLGSTGAKLFTCFYLFIGFVLLVVALRMWFDWMHRRREEAMAEAKQIVLFCLATGGDPVECYEQRQRKAWKQKWRVVRWHLELGRFKILRAALYLLLVLALFIVVLVTTEDTTDGKMNFEDALLWCLSVGTFSSLRDAFVVDDGPRVFVSLFLWLLNGAMLYFAFSVASSLFNGQETAVKRILRSRPIMKLRQADQTMGRTVDYATWQTLMLTTGIDAVDQQTIDLLQVNFARCQDAEGRATLGALCKPPQDHVVH